MRHIVLCLLAASLGPLAGCSRANASDANIGEPTPLGVAERVDRLQYLSNASSAATRAEDAYRHQKNPATDLEEAMRLIGLALKSASTGGEPIEASWESQINGALAQVKQAAESHDVSKGPIVDDGFNKVKIYIDQAQQAASIEY
jgi:hypothetical protein